jgi:inositol phosphorylceramide mannosyltransferase catalytic subunit
MAIPQIIHQTAATMYPPAWCEPLRHQILHRHPEWDHRFYDDAACRDVVGREFPHLLSLYDHYPLDIQRVDLFRVVVVYVSGGFYIDLDVACHASLEPLCEYRCVLGEEKTLSPQEAIRLGHRHRLRVANYMFGAEARHPFWLDVLQEMLRQAGRKIVSENDILESTGPGLWTNVYHRVKGDHPDILLLGNEHLACSRCGGISCQFGAFASHLHVGSWRWEGLSRPHPSVGKMVRAGSAIDHQHAWPVRGSANPD